MAYELPDSPQGYNYFQGNDVSALTASGPNWDQQIDQQNTDRQAALASSAQINQEEGARAASPEAVDTPIDSPPAGSQGGPQAADYSSRLQRVGESQTIPDNQPHPLLSDPRFKSIYQNDTTPKKAASQALYTKLTGRNIKDDQDLQTAQSDASSKLDQGVITNLVEKRGLRFDAITGPEAMDEQTHQYQPLAVSDPEQYKSLQRSYKDFTPGIDVPKGLNPYEAAQFRGNVKDIATQDTSKDSWNTKVQNAYNKAYSQGWNEQNNTKAIASNPASTPSNAPGFFARNIARFANMQSSAINAVRNPAMNYAAKTFGDSPGMRTAAGMFPQFERVGAQDTSDAMAAMTAGPRGLADTWANLPP